MPVKSVGTRPTRRVRAPSCLVFESYDMLSRVGLLGNAAQMGGKFHLKLNNGERPIANKYREGKMKRTLKRELKST